jgi:hypothetical protein
MGHSVGIEFDRVNKGACRGDCEFNEFNDFDRVVLEPLVPTRSRPGRHDGDLITAICMDAVHGTAQPKARNDAC